MMCYRKIFSVLITPVGYKVSPVCSVAKPVMITAALNSLLWRRPVAARFLYSKINSPENSKLQQHRRSVIQTTSTTDSKKLRRLYNKVTVEQQQQQCLAQQTSSDAFSSCGEWSVLLDGCQLQAPNGISVSLLPNQKTALLIAHEWDMQPKFFSLGLMPLTNLAIQTINHVLYQNSRVEVEKQILKFLQTDSLLFRESDAAIAEECSRTDSDCSSSSSVKSQQQQKFVAGCSSSLGAKQIEMLNPILRKVEKHYALEKQLQVSDLWQLPQQHQPDLDKLVSFLKQKNIWELFCLLTIVRNLKSYLLGISLLDGLISVEKACESAYLEEAYQQSIWGVVEGDHDVAKATITMWVNAAVLFHETVKKQVTN